MSLYFRDFLLLEYCGRGAFSLGGKVGATRWAGRSILFVLLVFAWPTFHVMLIDGYCLLGDLYHAFRARFAGFMT